MCKTTLAHLEETVNVSVCLYASAVLTAAPLLCKCVIQRVRTRTDGRTVLAILGTGEETISQFWLRWSQRERAHPFTVFGLDQLPHCYSDPVATSVNCRSNRSEMADQHWRQSRRHLWSVFTCVVMGHRIYTGPWSSPPASPSASSAHSACLCEVWIQSYNHKVLINVTMEKNWNKMWPFQSNYLRVLHVLSLLHMEQILAFHGLLQQCAIL